MIDVLTKKLSISYLIKQTNKGLVSVHHALQRSSGQWKPTDKSNLISDILQGNPIPEIILAEEGDDGNSVIFVLDGVQRLSTVQSYVNNEFKVSKKVERYEITYYVPVKDEDGVQIRDEKGKPIREPKVFDIRDKKFKNLPTELQDEFLEYNFNVVMYKNCSEENISYHLKRYNAGKPMNVEQKGLTYLGEYGANAVKNLSSMSFFEDAIGKYSASDFTNGRIYRVIVDSLMTTRFLDGWAKEFNDNCKYLGKNASGEDFEYLASLIERLEDNIDETAAKMFTPAKSFLWFGVYARFVKTGLRDSQFNRFMLEMKNGSTTVNEKGKEVARTPMTGICTIEIDGYTWETLLQNKSTKDVNVVKERINFLVKLMCKFLNVDVSEEDYSDELNEELKDFAQNFDSEDRAIETLMLTSEGHSFNDFKSDTLKKMIRWYKQYGNRGMLSNCLSYASFIEDVAIDMSDKNLPLYVYAAKCVFDADVDIAEWFAEFKKTGFEEIDADDRNIFEENYTIRLKQDLIKTHINKFKYEGEEVNEYDV